MKREAIRLDDIAHRDVLALATYRAAKGKRHRPEVRAFLEHLEDHLAALGQSIRDGTVAIGNGVHFRIRDPKPRAIFAPCFRERVLHHALMARVGPVLDRALVADSFACRVGKGTLAAVRRAQEHVRRAPWYAKMDVRSYFASIDHARLRDRLRRRIQGDAVLALIDRILAAHQDGPGRGLPIGALTSQCFANFYLDPLDRFLLEGCPTLGYLRYMDDFIFWTATRADAVRLVGDVRAFLAERLALTGKDAVQVNRSARGITICGVRVLTGTLRPGRRRRRRYLDAKRRAEAAFVSGRIDALGLQRAHDAAWAILAHTDAAPWLRARLTDRPEPAWHDGV